MPRSLAGLTSLRSAPLASLQKVSKIYRCLCSWKLIVLQVHLPLALRLDVVRLGRHVFFNIQVQ